MGVTVRQKRKGRGEPWYVFNHQGGIIRSKLIGDRRAAEAVASEIRRKIAVGEFRLNPIGGGEDRQAPEFAAYAEHYLTSYAEATLKRNTWQGYRVIIEKHLASTWAGRRLDEIKRKDVKLLLLQKQRDGLAPGTVENIKALISGIFSHAYEDEILSVNPALKLGKFIQKSGQRSHANFASPEHVAHILAIAQEQFAEHYPFILCAFRTGMRLGELLGLAWEDIHFDSCNIEVCRSYSHGYFSTPKSNKTRQIDMSNQLKLVLQNHRERMKKRFDGALPVYEVPARLKGGTAVHLAFANERGGPIDGDNFRHRVFNALIEKADVPRMRFHDIRHTFASLLLQQGAPVHYVKEQMGHASITTTVDTYGHVMPNANRNAINKLDELSFPTKEPALALAS